MNPFDLTGKRALVAGASRGIGLAIAQHLAAAGADTILAARSLDKLEAAAADLRGKGLKASALALDFSDPSSFQAGAEAAGDVDILINVSGTNLRKRFVDYTKEEYERILQVNLHGIFEFTQLVGKKMIARGKGGKVIFIGSMMSIVGLPYLSVYAVTKGALGQLTKVLAAEWGRENIQVNCIAPGFIITDLNRQMWQEPELNRWVKGAQGNPRLGAPEDVAPLAVFLSSPGSDYITGQIVCVDGGYSTTKVWPFEP